jgi:hypothetical protein
VSPYWAASGAEKRIKRVATRSIVVGLCINPNAVRDID